MDYQGLSWGMLQHQITTNVSQHLSTKNLLIDTVILIVISMVLNHAKTYIYTLWEKMLNWYNHKRHTIDNTIVLTFQKPKSDQYARTNFIDHKQLHFDNFVKCICYYLYKNNIISTKVGCESQYISEIRHLESLSDNTKEYYTSISVDSLPNDYLKIYDNIWISLDNQMTDNGKEKEMISTLKIKTNKSINEIYKFLDVIHDFYYNNIVDKKKSERAMYSYNGELWDRYLLTKKRSFDSFFHPQKKEILKLIDHFKNKTGIYKYDAVTHSIGFLLYGPPGTGKTTFIKMLAAALERNPITLNFNTIKTNTQILNIFHGITFSTQCEYGNSCYEIKNERKIIIMEDIDCISDIVKKRSEEKEKKKEKEKKISDEEFEIEDDVSISLSKKKSTVDFKRYEKDPLTLSGILNVLQGTIDNEDLIWIMTTNHPEKLDPALIRPGRIHMKIKLDYIQLPEIIEMLQYYYPEESFDPALIQKKSDITPAEVETWCISCTSVNDVIALINSY